MIRVFIDTSIARYAVQKRTHWLKHKEMMQWRTIKQELDIVREHTEYPLEKLNTVEHKETYTDALLIPEIEALAKAGLITLCWHLETHMELARHRNLGDPPFSSILDHIGKANCPMYYGRPIVSRFGEEQKDEQLLFLQRIRHPEYDKWKQLIGFQPGTKNERNQLMDAWHLWSADHNHCDYFLTMDYKLISSVASRKRTCKLRLVAPKQFLEEFKILRRSAELELEGWKKITTKLS